jgi:hypothetical protein
MTLGTVLRGLLFAIAIVLLLVLAWTGINGGIHQLSTTATTGQTIQTALQLLYGALSVLSIVTVYWARRCNRPVLACWTISLALAGGLGATEWGGASLRIGIVSAAAAGLVGAGIAWLLRIGARRTLLP